METASLFHMALIKMQCALARASPSYSPMKVQDNGNKLTGAFLNFKIWASILKSVYYFKVSLNVGQPMRRRVQHRCSVSNYIEIYFLFARREMFLNLNSRSSISHMVHDENAYVIYYTSAVT